MLLNTVTHLKPAVIPCLVLPVTVFLYLYFHNSAYSCFFVTGDSPAAGHDAFAKRVGAGTEPTLW